MGRPGLFFVLLACAPALLGACATTQTGKIAYPIDFRGQLSKSPRTRSELVIRAREITDLSSPYFGFIEVTFANDSAGWVRIRRVGLDFRDVEKNESIMVTAGSDLDSWEEAILQRNEVRRVNRDTTLAFIGMGGAVVAAAAPKSAVGAAGAAVTLGAVSLSVAHSISDRVNAAETVALFPESHLFSVPISIPPKLFAKRWVVLNSRDSSTNPCVQGVVLDYETDEGLIEHAWITLDSQRSEWNVRSCQSRRR